MYSSRLKLVTGFRVDDSVKRGASDSLQRFVSGGFALEG